jgi:putative nucleotidyltransferase with HDIG domain
MADADLKRFIAKVEDLPTLPRTVLQITEFINDPRADTKNLSRLITDDQVLTARLLKLVNSSFYGFQQRVATVSSAILLVGFDAIRNHLLTTSVFDLFPSRTAQSRRDQEMFWDHSLACAVGAKVIGAAVRCEKLEELFVAGLLHDIGKIVEMTMQPEDFGRVAERVREGGRSIYAAEMEVLGHTHADIGRFLAERWNLPLKLVHIIAQHHTPTAGGAFAVESSIVHLADVLARALQLGSGGDPMVPPVDHAAWELLRLKPAALDDIMAAMLAEFEDIGSFLR